MSIFSTCLELHFSGQKAFFCIQNIKKCFFRPFLVKKKHIRKRSIFWQKPWTNPFAKCRFFFTLQELHFSGLKSILFYPEYQKMFLSGLFCSKKKIWKKVRFFDKKNLLGPLQNVDCFWLCENFTFEVQKALFAIQNIKKCFFLAFLLKKTHIRKRSIFDKNHGLNPLQNVDFSDYVRTLQFRSKKDSLLFRRSKNVSFWLFFAQNNR